MADKLRQKAVQKLLTRRLSGKTKGNLEAELKRLNKRR